VRPRETCLGGGQVTQTTVTDPNGNVRVLNFNSAGYITSETQASGTALAQTTTYTRNTANLVTATIDALGRTTNYSYNSLGDLTAATLLAGTSSAVIYSFAFNTTFNELTSITDPLSHTTSYQFSSVQGLSRLPKQSYWVSCPHVRGNMPSGFRVKIQKNIHSLGIDILISSKYLR